MRITALLTTLLLLGSAVDGRTQFNGLTSAGGTTALVDNGTSVLSFDTKADKVQFLYRSAASDKKGRRGHDFRFVLGTSSDRSTLFTGGRWRAEFSLEDRYVISRYDQGDATGMTSYFVVPSYTLAEHALASSAPDGTRLSQATTHTTGLGFGVSRTFSAPGWTLGASSTVEYAWNQPEAASPSNVCTVVPAGTDADGNAIQVTRCSSRYVGGTRDALVGTLRVDILTPHLFDRYRASPRLAQLEREMTAAAAVVDEADRDHDFDESDCSACLASNDEALRTYCAARDTLSQIRRALDEESARDAERANLRPTITVLGSAAAKAVEGQPTRINLSVGPLMHLPGGPAKVLGALLVEVEDVTGALDSDSGWRDRVSLRLHVGVPIGT